MWGTTGSGMIGMVLVIVGWLISIYAIFAQLGRDNFDASNETSLAKFVASQRKGVGA